MHEHISLWLDNAKVGCGWRRYIVKKVGRRWAHLTSTETGATIKVLKGELRFAKPVKEKPARLARHMRAIMRERKRWAALRAQQ